MPHRESGRVGGVLRHSEGVDPTFELALMQYRSLLQEAKGLAEQRAAKLMLAKSIARAYNLATTSK